MIIVLEKIIASLLVMSGVVFFTTPHRSAAHTWACLVWTVSGILGVLLIIWS